jgi:hypothetical protein
MLIYNGQRPKVATQLTTPSFNKPTDKAFVSKSTWATLITKRSSTSQTEDFS